MQHNQICQTHIKTTAHKTKTMIELCCITITRALKQVGLKTTVNTEQSVYCNRCN